MNASGWRRLSEMVGEKSLVLNPYHWNLARVASIVASCGHLNSLGWVRCPALDRSASGKTGVQSALR